MRRSVGRLRRSMLDVVESALMLYGRAQVTTERFDDRKILA